MKVVEKATVTGKSAKQTKVAITNGLRPVRSAIFAAGTINNARQLGLEKDYGTIEKGRIANLLLLDANPLADLEAWTKIDKVILHGEPIDRETLAADAR